MVNSLEQVIMGAQLPEVADVNELMMLSSLQLGSLIIDKKVF